MNTRNQFALLFVLLSCFLTHTNAQYRVINGCNIQIEESPHSVAIFGDGYYSCVGSLVNMNSVVTAAHCVKDKDVRNLVVVAGVTDLFEIYRGGGGQCRRVQHIHQDCGYDPQTKFMDVAVVKVDRSFDETSAVKSISLCDDRLVPGTTLQVSGWGRISTTSAVHSYPLQTKHLDIVDTQQCKTEYEMVVSINIAETIICAGCGGEDVCNGDSGAGGVLNRRLCAVVQGGCEDPFLPDLYTDVTNSIVRDFIISKM